MKCNDVQIQLVDFLDNKLDKPAYEQISSHLKTCEKCRHDAGEMQKILQAIKETKPGMPSAALRENFNTMLQSEQNMMAIGNILKEGPERKTISISWSSDLLKIAAVLIVFVLGFWIGNKTKTTIEPTAITQITDLKKDVKNMKETLMLSLLKEESASERIKAVNFVEDMPNPNQKIISALVNTLDHDKNVNVRLASAYSLAKFSDEQAVRDSLITSLSKQTEPIIQVTLINILAEKKEIRAAKTIRDIISNEKTLKEVKEIAQKGLRTL